VDKVEVALGRRRLSNPHKTTFKRDLGVPGLLDRTQDSQWFLVLKPLFLVSTIDIVAAIVLALNQYDVGRAQLALRSKQGGKPLGQPWSYQRPGEPRRRKRVDGRFRPFVG
jgi:hypothetical protein